MNVILDLHDFSVVNNRLGVLYSLKNYFNDFKISLFTVPVDTIADWGAYLLREEYLKEIKKNLDWIEIIPHGFYHNGRECRNWDYYLTKRALDRVEKIFKDEGLPYAKGFCAPHWVWNEAVVKALDDRGWFGAVYKHESYPYPKKFYAFNYRIDEDFPLDRDIKLHGHVYGTKNDVDKCLGNILRLPKDTKFHFVSEGVQSEAFF